MAEGIKKGYQRKIKKAKLVEKNKTGICNSHVEIVGVPKKFRNYLIRYNQINNTIKSLYEQHIDNNYVFPESLINNCDKIIELLCKTLKEIMLSLQ
jgi:predicted helicase